MVRILPSLARTCGLLCLALCSTSVGGREGVTTLQLSPLRTYSIGPVIASGRSA